MRSLGSKLSGIHRVVELPLLCFDATARRHSRAINVPRPLPSLISRRFTCHDACFSLSRWHLAAGHATACPVHKTKHGRCAALLCHTGVGGQLLPCSRMLHLFLFLFLLLLLPLSSLWPLLSAIVCPSVSRFPVFRMPYAVSRFLIYAIPCMCHISAAKHAVHAACGSATRLQQKYHKKCHKRAT